MIMYMDCTVQSGLQFYGWFGVELRKVSVECTCQEFQVRLTLKKCRFINAEFTVRMNPFSVEAWTRLGKIMLHTRHKDHNTQLYWWTGCMLPEIYVP